MSERISCKTLTASATAPLSTTGCGLWHGLPVVLSDWATLASIWGHRPWPDFLDWRWPWSEELGRKTQQFILLGRLAVYN